MNKTLEILLYNNNISISISIINNNKQLLHNYVPTVDCLASRLYRHSDVGVLRTAIPEL